MTMEMFEQVLPDIPRFYTALAEWLACFVCVYWTKRRLRGWRFGLFSAGALVVQSMFLIMTKGQKDFLWILCMAAAVAMMYFYIMMVSDVNWKDGAYYCTGAFVAAESAASLEWQLDCFFSYGQEWNAPGVKLVWLVVVYGIFFGVMCWVYKGDRFRRGNDALQVTNQEVVSYMTIGLAVFMISNLGFISLRTPFSGIYMAEIFNVRTIIDLGGLAILYAYHAQRMELKARNELENMQTILHNQYIQYQQAQEAIDIINYKHHDLKHHILALRAEENEKKRNEYLDQMEAEIQAYEAQNKTGHKVLDTLLTAKNLYCMKNDITMTCVVDGTLFAFMDVMDICSIFGNALDNAIECEKKVPEKEKRLIHVSAYSQRNFLIVRIENYCEEDVDFREALPVTTKKNAGNHGYGTKSLRYIVRKYGGEVDFAVQDNWFTVKILIPISKESQK